MALNWNKYKSSEGSRFFKFEGIGDSISGTIVSIEEGKDFNQKACPELLIETDEGNKQVTCGQVMLQSALAEKEPEEGDFIAITYYANGEGKPGRAPAKLFKVDVKRGGAVGAEDLV